MVTKYLGREISCSQPKHALKVPCFFSFYVLGWGMGGDFFFIFRSFPICLHYVPFKFQMGSRYVPQFRNVFPFLHTTSLVSYMLLKMVSSFHLHRWAKGEDLYTSKQSLLFWEVSIVSFFWSDRPIKLARRQKK